MDWRKFETLLLTLLAALLWVLISIPVAVAGPLGRLPEAAGDGPMLARTDFRFGAKR